MTLNPYQRQHRLLTGLTRPLGPAWRWAAATIVGLCALLPLFIGLAVLVTEDLGLIGTAAALLAVVWGVFLGAAAIAIARGRFNAMPTQARLSLTSGILLLVTLLLAMAGDVAMQLTALLSFALPLQLIQAGLRDLRNERSEY